MPSEKTKSQPNPQSSSRRTAAAPIRRSVRSSGKVKFSSFISPMLATLHDKAFDDEAWLFEAKWDGYRAIAEIRDGDVRLYSRNGLSFAELYPKVVVALKNWATGDVVLDGEIVVLNKDGKPDFQKLQQYGDHPTLPIVYYAFDCLSYKGKSITELPLIERKNILKGLIGDNPVIRFSDHIHARGISCFEQAVKLDLEGIIAKRATSTYLPGKRSKDWLKIKNHNTQEAIIAGYTQPRGSRQNIGALILAVRDGKNLRYIGHTGTGFNNQTLKDLYKQFQPLVRTSSPFTKKIPVKAGVTWLEPTLVCAVKFTEITADGILRHPVFLGLRIDKSAKETTSVDIPIQRAAEKKTRGSSEKQSPLLTNLTKVYWPDEGITKGDVIKYYNTIHKLILPHLKDRPQSLHRHPNGISKNSFFQKNAAPSTPSFVKTVKLRAESVNRDINYILCNDLATLQYLNNLGCIELNPWTSRTKSLTRPDYLVIDLDPSEKNDFQQVIELALIIKNICDQAGATSYCKTSGSSGIHIYLPMGARYDYAAVRSLAELISTLAVQHAPSFATTERSLDKRKGRIYVDYEQNKTGQTVASVYCLRPRPKAPVSTPLRWKELKAGLSPTDFTIKNAPKRFEKTGDLFAPVLSEKTDIKTCIKNLRYLNKNL